MKTDSRDPGNDSGPWEFGEWLAGGAGRRTDILACHKRILDGATEADVCSEFPETFVKYHSGLNRMILLNVRPRTTPPTVVLCYGKTGTGKTKYAYDIHPQLYRKPCDTRWFDGYLDQDVLLLDDFGGASSKMGLLYLLQLLDRYPLIVEAKGKYVSMQATKIVITTNYHPRLWYTYLNREESYNALKRRIHTVLHFTKFGEAPRVVDNQCFYQEFYAGIDTTDYCIPIDGDEVDETQPTEEHSESSEEPEAGLSQHELLELLSKDTGIN